MSSKGWARFFCRAMLGLLFFVAGFFKTFEMTPLVHADTYFVEPYANSWIPHFLLLGVGVLVPLVELVAGFLLLIGWRVRLALVVLGFLLLMVTYGHQLAQPIYDISGHIFPRLVLMLAVFLIPAHQDRFSLDSWIGKKG